jgi:hypothetical protein
MRIPLISYAFEEAAHRRALSTIVGLLAQVGNQAGLFQYPFYASNVPADNTYRQMRRLVADGGGTTVLARQLGLVVPFDCSLVAMALSSDTSVGAGSADFQIAINGVQSTDSTLTWGSSDHAFQAFTFGLVSLAAGDILRAWVKGSNTFGATGADLSLDVFLVRV